MSDDNPLLTEAVDIVARSIIAQLVEFPGISLDWEDFPEIGEKDWERVQVRMSELAVRPKNELYDAAYQFLQKRSAGVEA